MTPETILGTPRGSRGADWRILDAARGVLGTDWGIDAQPRPLGEGIIHDTFIVEGTGDPLVLQRVNGSVFPDLDLLMENVARVSAHLSAKQPGWAPALVPTAAGASCTRTGDQVWRLWTYLAGASAWSEVATDRQAHIVGTGFGRTYRWLQDLSGPRLQDTIPGFLQLDHYLGEFDQCRGAPPELASAVDARRSLAALFRKRTGYIHGDCRVEHLVLDTSGKAAGVLDLDTVMWGNWAWEFGDLVRSMSGDRLVPSRFEAAARDTLTRLKSLQRRRNWFSLHATPRSCLPSDFSPTTCRATVISKPRSAARICGARWRSSGCWRGWNPCSSPCSGAPGLCWKREDFGPHSPLTLPGGGPGMDKT